MATLAEVLGNEYFKLCTQRFIICIGGDFDSFDCLPGRFIELPDCNWYNYDDESDIYELFEEDEDLKDLIPWLEREVEEVDSAIDWSEVVAVRDTNYEGRDHGVYVPVMKIVLEGELEDGDEEILNNPKLVCKKNCYMPPKRKNWPFTKDGDGEYSIWPYHIKYEKFEKVKNILEHTFDVYDIDQDIIRHVACFIINYGHERVARMTDESAKTFIDDCIKTEGAPENPFAFFGARSERDFRLFVYSVVKSAREIVDVLDTRELMDFLLISPCIRPKSIYH